MPREDVERTFHDLKREGSQAPAPDETTWRKHLDRQERLAAVLLGPEDRTALQSRMDRARAAGIPDGPTFYAQQNLVAECEKRRGTALLNRPSATAGTELSHDPAPDGNPQDFSWTSESMDERAAHLSSSRAAEPDEADDRPFIPTEPVNPPF